MRVIANHGRRRFLARSGVAMAASSLPFRAFAFEHDYPEWGSLLSKNVAWNSSGVASSADYAGFAREKARFDRVLSSFSAVGRSQFDAFSRSQRLSFLINAYNAFTVSLILTKYPNLESIKDLGSLFRSPWKQKFFKLLGEERHLDDIEHGMIRAPGAYDEPRIHFVVNCASIGCPALRPEAMRANSLDAQLTDSASRFLRDRSRNRFDDSRGVLLVSKIFDWYGDDFEKGLGGITSLKAFFGAHATDLGGTAAEIDRIRAGRFDIDFLDYDWRLNDRH